MLDVAIIRTLREVDALQPEWDDLETQTPEATGFQSFTWCRQWLALAGEHGHRNIQPLVVTVRIAGRLVMLCPLQHVSVAGLRVARWIGEPLTQYGDVLAEPGPGRPAWQDAAEAAIRETRDIDLILFKHVRSDGVFKVRTRQDTGGHQVVGLQIVGHETIGPDAAAPFIDLEAPSTPTILASHHRRLRRRQRRLASRGIIGIETDLQPALRAEAVRTAFAFKQAWLKHKGLFSRGLSHRLSAMFLERLARDGHLATSVLRVGAETAAVELGLHRGVACSATIKLRTSRQSG